MTAAAAVVEIVSVLVLCNEALTREGQALDDHIVTPSDRCDGELSVEGPQ